MASVKIPHLNLYSLPEYGKSLGKAGKTAGSKVGEFAKQFPWKPLGYAAAASLIVPVAIIGALPWMILAAISAGIIGPSYVPYKVYTTAFKKNGPFSQAKEDIPNPPPPPPENWMPSNPKKEPAFVVVPRENTVSLKSAAAKNNDKVNIADVIANQMQTQEHSAMFQFIHEQAEEFEGHENPEIDDDEWDLPDGIY